MAGSTFFIAESELYKIEKPYSIDQVRSDSGIQLSNILHEKHDFEPRDVRDLDFAPSIDTHSFCYVTYPSQFTDLQTEEEMMIPYARETTSFLKTFFGTDHAICFDLRWRRNQQYTEEQRTSDSRSIPTPTVHEAHLDATPGDGWSRIRKWLTDEEIAKFCSGKWRARIINAWRPLFRPVEDSPIAFCDPSTVDLNDLISTDMVAPGAWLETYQLKYNAEQKWYWINRQTPDEIVLFVVFDSHPPGGKFNFVPHTAFYSKSAPPGSPPRQSVETRTIIFTPAPYDAPLLDRRMESIMQPWKKYVDHTSPPLPISMLSGEVRLLETG